MHKITLLACLITTAALAVAPATAQVPEVQVPLGLTGSMSVSNPDAVIGGQGYTWCQRVTIDSCYQNIASFYANWYNINWCLAGNTCNGISGGTTGTVDMLRSGNHAWCVNVDNGVWVASCTASFGTTAQIAAGNVASYSHPIDGWFKGEMSS